MNRCRACDSILPAARKIRAIAKGQSSVDLMDRTAGNHPDWMVVKPFVTQASNCILPTYVVAAYVEYVATLPGISTYGHISLQRCGEAYSRTQRSGYTTACTRKTLLILRWLRHDNYATPGYPGFDPATAPNDGQGFDKDLGGNELPNAPPFTVSMSARIYHATHDGLGRYAARRLLLAGLFLGARLQRQSV